MRHIDILDRHNFHEFKVSVKASNVFLTLDAYRLLSKQMDNPLHLGVTEAGVFRSGTVKSAIALGRIVAGRDWRHPAHFVGGRTGRRSTGRVSISSSHWASVPTGLISLPAPVAHVRSLMSSA
jgi:hypothetical protein